MAIAFVDKTNGKDSTAATNHVLSRPSGTSTGNLLLAYIFLAEDEVITAPAGWTNIFTIGETPGNDSGQYFWWRIAAGGDPSTWTFTTSASRQAVFGMSAWSGHDPDHPVDAWDLKSQTNANAITPASVARRAGVAICSASKATDTGTDFSLPGGLTSLLAYDEASGIGAIAGYKTTTAGGVAAEDFGNPGSTLDWIASVLVLNQDYSPSNTPGASAFSNAVLALSPAGYWRLADEYGVTVDDAVGSNDGTIGGTSVLTYAPPIFPGLPASAQFGAPSVDLSAMTRAGGAGYVSLPSVNWWPTTPMVYSIIACVKPFGATVRQTIFGASGTSSKPQMEVETDGSLDLIVEGTFVWDSAAGVIAANTPYFIVFTRNGSGNTWAMYVNGSSVTDSSPGTTSQTSGAFVGLIGARTTTTQPFWGLISDVALFTTVLSSSNVSALYALLIGSTFSGESRFGTPALIG